MVCPCKVQVVKDIVEDILLWGFFLSGYEWVGSGSCGVKRTTPKVLMDLGSCHHIHDMGSVIRMAGHHRCCSARVCSFDFCNYGVELRANAAVQMTHLHKE